MSSKQSKIIRKELRKMGAVDLIKDITEKAGEELNSNIDGRLNAHLKKKPWWLPYPIYIKIVKALFIVEVSNKAGASHEQIADKN